MNAHERKYEEWAHFSAVINPELKYVKRTSPEIREAVELTKYAIQNQRFQDCYCEKEIII